MYSILFLCILFILLVFLLVKQINKNINLFVTLILTLIILYFLINPSESIKYALAGAKLFVTAIIPTTFPFMVICNLLMSFDGIKIYSKVLGPIICKPLKLSYSSSFAIVVSLLCGYPLGAKYSTELYKNKNISHSEFKRLLNIASNVGPLFLVGAVGTAMLENTTLGYILLIPNYLSIFIMGIITIKKEELAPLFEENPSYNNKPKNLGETIKNSIQDALNTILLIGGYVIMFSVIINIIKHNPISNIIGYELGKITAIPKELLTGFFLGSIEITNGCNIVSSSDVSMLSKLCILSFFSSFGGLSVIAQTSSFFYKYNISITKYFLYKLLQGFISLIITFIIYLFIGDSLTTFVSVTTYSTPIITITPIILLLLLTLLVLLVYKLFHIS